MVGVRDAVDRVDVERWDHARFPEIAEECDLLAGSLGDRPIAAAEQNVRLNAEAQQLLDRVLRGLGLELSRRRNPRHQGQMHIEDPLAAELVPHLPDRLQERQALDVADRAADLAQDEILVGEIGLDEFLDGIGDVRDHLHRGA